MSDDRIHRLNIFFLHSEISLFIVFRVVHTDSRQPFARVDEINDQQSPAAKCGLKVEDLILQFGSVTLQVFYHDSSDYLISFFADHLAW